MRIRHNTEPFPENWCYWHGLDNERCDADCVERNAKIREDARRGEELRENRPVSDFGDCDPSIPIGHRVSGVLTELRTVLNRAQTALATLEPALESGNLHDHLEWRYDADGKNGFTVPVSTHPDPDRRQAVADLRQVVSLLAKYERTSKKKLKGRD